MKKVECAGMRGASTARMTAADIALSKLPGIIRVGAFDLEIEKINPLQASAEGNYGRFSVCRQMIGIQWGMPSVHKLVDTLLHEIFHAIWWVHDAEDDWKQEKYAAMSGTGWTAVHRDNPWLAKWISETLR